MGRLARHLFDQSAERLERARGAHLRTSVAERRARLPRFQPGARSVRRSQHVGRRAARVALLAIRGAVSKKETDDGDQITGKLPETLFLACRIEMGEAENWQERVARELSNVPNLTILNPRRDDWDRSWVQSIAD